MFSMEIKYLYFSFRLYTTLALEPLTGLNKLYLLIGMSNNRMKQSV